MHGLCQRQQRPADHDTVYSVRANLLTDMHQACPSALAGSNCKISVKIGPHSFRIYPAQLEHLEASAGASGTCVRRACLCQSLQAVMMTLHTFGGEAAVGEAHDGLAPRLQHSVHLLEHLQGLGQIVHRDSICDDVKAVVLVWELGICKNRASPAHLLTER